MYLEEIKQSKFAQINEKRYYFSDGIVFFPFFHPHLSEIVKFKQEKKQRVATYICKEKQKLLKMK